MAEDPRSTDGGADAFDAPVGDAGEELETASGDVVTATGEAAAVARFSLTDAVAAPGPGWGHVFGELAWLSGDVAATELPDCKPCGEGCCSQRSQSWRLRTWLPCTSSSVEKRRASAMMATSVVRLRRRLKVASNCSGSQPSRGSIWPRRNSSCMRLASEK